MTNVDELLNMNDKEFDEKIKNMPYDELRNLHNVLCMEFHKSLMDLIKNIEEYDNE